MHGAQGGINCNNCHDSDPFILSPWIAGAKRSADYKYASLDPAGSKVPESIYEGSGEIMLFHKGEVVRGTWQKKHRQTPIKLRTKAGPLKVPAGNVWIELVPTKKDGGNVRIGR